MVRYLIVCGVALALAVSAIPSAVADHSANTCRMYIGLDSNTPKDVGEILEKSKGATVQICEPRGTATQSRTNVFSPAWKGRLGVCHTRSTELFRVRMNSIHEQWSYLPTAKKSGQSDVAPATSELYMAMPDRECPRQDSEKYLPVDGISEGLFVGLMNFWASISRDEKGFDAAFLELDAAKRSSVEFARFRAMALNKKGTGALSVANISYLGPLPYRSLGVPTIRRFSNYVMRISVPHASSESYELDVDLDGNLFKVLGFAVVAT